MRYYHNSIGERRRIFLVAAILMSTLLLMSCQVPTQYPSGSEAEPSSPVTIAAGDVVEVKFFYTPQLNETQAVRPDGKIALQLVGEVEAQGMTPVGLQNKLLRLYTPELKDPDIAVIVRSFFNRRVFIGGQVMTPSIVEMPGKLTVLEAIMQAGGFDMREAEVQNVIIIRHKEGQRYGYSINLKPMMTGGETQPFFLEPQDIVYVPRTEIAKANQWIDQHINRLIPQSGFFFSRQSGRTVIGMDTSVR